MVTKRQLKKQVAELKAKNDKMFCDNMGLLIEIDNLEFEIKTLKRKQKHLQDYNDKLKFYLDVWGVVI